MSSTRTAPIRWCCWRWPQQPRSVRPSLAGPAVCGASSRSPTPRSNTAASPPGGWWRAWPPKKGSNLTGIRCSNPAARPGRTAPPGPGHRQSQSAHPRSEDQRLARRSPGPSSQIQIEFGLCSSPCLCAKNRTRPPATPTTSEGRSRGGPAAMGAVDLAPLVE